MTSGTSERLADTAFTSGSRRLIWVVLLAVAGQAVFSSWQVGANLPSTGGTAAIHEVDFASHPSWGWTGLTVAIAAAGWLTAVHRKNRRRGDEHQTLNVTVKAIIAITLLVALLLPAQVFWVQWATHHGIEHPFILWNVTTTQRTYNL